MYKNGKIIRNKIYHRVFLAGLMGSGKTKVGPFLARLLGWNFLDLDHALEASFGIPISTWIKIHGEPAFRDRESTALREKSDVAQTVISLGGGAVLRDENRKWIKENGILVYLKTEIKTLAHRLEKNQTHHRPLIQGLHGDLLFNRLQTLLDQRASLYEEANFTVQTDLKSPLEVASEILKYYENQKN